MLQAVFIDGPWAGIDISVPAGIPRVRFKNATYVLSDDGSYRLEMKRRVTLVGGRFCGMELTTEASPVLMIPVPDRLGVVAVYHEMPACMEKMYFFEERIR